MKIKISCQILWDALKAVLWGKYRTIKTHFKKIRKTENEQSDSTTEETRKRRALALQNQCKKEINKNRTEINGIENKTVQTISETNSSFLGKKIDKIDP